MPIGTAAVLGGAAISGLLGGAFSALSGKKQLQAVRETNEANRELAMLQNQWNLEQWQREADWQSTPNQIQMWKDAGLNPNFFNGGTVAPTTQSADLANQVAPDVASPYMHIGDSIQRGFDQGLNGLLQIYQMKKLKQETTNLTSQNEFIQASTKEMLSKCGLNDSEIQKNSKVVQMMEKQMGALDVQMNLWNATANREDATANEMRLRQKMLIDTWDDQKQSYKLQNLLLSSEIVKNREDAALIAQKFKTEVFETGIKSRNFEISEFNNWLSKMMGSLDCLEKLNAQEKQNFTSQMYGFFASLLESSDDFENDKRGASKRYRRMSNARGMVLDRIESYRNPDGF